MNKRDTSLHSGSKAMKELFVFLINGDVADLTLTVAATILKTKNHKTSTPRWTVRKKKEWKESESPMIINIQTNLESPFFWTKYQRKGLHCLPLRIYLSPNP